MPDYLNGHHPDMVVPGYRALSQLKLYSFKKKIFTQNNSSCRKAAIE
ncbi:hypothetical protein FORC065_3045 [Yersinia enterocolitica]|nr:hypothetical protein FORC065_3045 [Yersinia enterocolitica]